MAAVDQKHVEAAVQCRLCRIGIAGRDPLHHRLCELGIALAVAIDRIGHQIAVVVIAVVLKGQQLQIFAP